MSAPSTLPPEEDSPPETQSTRAVVDAVDLYDTVAHLESIGLGDAAARKAGHKDAFEHATVLRERHLKTHPTSHEPAPFPRLYSTLTDAAERVFIMLTGVIFCLATFPRDVSENLIFVAGATGWLSGQVVSAGVWKALGTGSRRTSAVIAIRASMGMLLAGAACSIIIGAGAILLWVTWACAASTIVILSDKTRTLHRWARILLLGGAATAAILVPHPYGHVIAVAAILTLWMVAVVLVLDVMRHSTKTTQVQPLGVIVLAVIQTLAQVLVLWCFMRLMGSAVFAAMAVAGLVAGAISDLILEFGHDRVKRIAHYSTCWHRGRRTMTLIGLGTVALILAATNGTVIGLSIYTGGFETNALLLISAATMVGALTTGTGLLLRSAAAEGAATFATTAAVLTLSTLVLHTGYPHLLTYALPAATAIVLAIATAIAIQRFTHPSTW